MHHGVPVRVFFVGRRSTTAEATAAAAYLEVTTHMFFSHGRTLVVPGTFLRVLYNIHHHVLVAFVRELEEKEKNTEQDQPAVRTGSAVVAAAAAAAEVRFSMTCRFVDGQGKRGNVHIPAIMSVAFPDVIVFDGFI